MLEKYIKARLEDQSLLLMTHAVVGYPSLEDNWNMLENMNRAGIDLVELQLPFSEPIADGPAFIRANQFALEHGIHWKEYFDFFKRASESFDFPLLFMGYYNSVFCMGHEVFCDRLTAAGGQGFIIADLPMEDSSELDMLAASRELDHVQILTPVNSETRLRQIVGKASGFLYFAARKGVTGRETDFNLELDDYLKRCRSLTDLPLAVGFGIKTAEQIANLKNSADIAIIGTACLQVWEEQGADGYQEYLEELRKAAR